MARHQHPKPPVLPVAQKHIPAKPKVGALMLASPNRAGQLPTEQRGNPLTIALSSIWRLIK